MSKKTVKKAAKGTKKSTKKTKKKTATRKRRAPVKKVAKPVEIETLEVEKTKSKVDELVKHQIRYLLDDLPFLEIVEDDKIPEHLVLANKITYFFRVRDRRLHNPENALKIWSIFMERMLASFNGEFFDVSQFYIYVDGKGLLRGWRLGIDPQILSLFKSWLTEELQENNFTDAILKVGVKNKSVEKPKKQPKKVSPAKAAIKKIKTTEQGEEIQIRLPFYPEELHDRNVPRQGFFRGAKKTSGGGR